MRLGARPARPGARRGTNVIEVVLVLGMVALAVIAALQIWGRVAR